MIRDYFLELYQATHDADKGDDVALERKLALAELLRDRFGAESVDRALESIRRHQTAV